MTVWNRLLSITITFTKKNLSVNNFYYHLIKLNFHVILVLEAL